jgi:5-methylcytosine-specific restriction endonuclease McrA
MRQSNPIGVLATSVLVLNRAFLAVHVVNVRRAFCLMFRDLAEVIDIEDGRFSNYDFESWLLISDLRSAEDREFDDWVRSVNFQIQVPRIIRLLNFDRVPKQTLRFNRRNLFARDNHRCQYCGQHAPPQQLSMDHVLPRSRGGRTTWENIVCCCVKCNTQKGGRTPREARMRLLTKPAKPRYNPLLAQKLDNPKYHSWRTFVKMPRSAGGNVGTFHSRHRAS